MKKNADKIRWVSRTHESAVNFGTTRKSEGSHSMVVMTMTVADPVAAGLARMERLWVEAVDRPTNTLEGMNDLRWLARLTRGGVSD